jgi:hypothetical protein
MPGLNPVQLTAEISVAIKKKLVGCQFEDLRHVIVNDNVLSN